MPEKESKNIHATVNFKVDKERDFKRYVKYLSNPWHIIWRNFLAGTFYGLGIILGGAIVLTLVGFLLKDVVGKLPIFSDYAENAKLWLETTQ